MIQPTNPSWWKLMGVNEEEIINISQKLLDVYPDYK